jgi:hypothetical protein
MVYDHIIGSDDGEVVVTISQTRLYRFHADRITCQDTLHGTLEPGENLLGLSPLRCQDLHTLSWWRNDYMGTNIARELIERWYATRVFQFSASRSPSILCAIVSTFFQTGPFGKTFDHSALLQHIEFSC